MTSKLSLTGLRIGSPQSMGAVRLVPILRDDPPGDLRIGLRSYGESLGIVGVDTRPLERGTHYVSYVPHAFVVSYTDGETSAALGTRLGDEERGGKSFIRLHHRMVKSELADDDGPRRFRLLPLHLAMEGFLALHFRGPDVLWSEYSEHAHRFGLSPRMERSVRGTWIRGLEQAVATFEIHPRQVGVLCFVAETLASAFVVSHPDDYRKLHTSLLEDFYGHLLYQYALFHPELPRAESRVDVDVVATLADLEREVERVRGDWVSYVSLMASGLFDRPITVERVRTSGPFVLERFLPSFDLDEECHIGERIVRKDGTLEYLKTFRLSQAQIRRAYLLELIAKADWNLDTVCERLASSKEEFLKRLVNAGFEYLLKPHIVRGLSR